jgi:hypothetical protein
MSGQSGFGSARSSPRRGGSWPGSPNLRRRPFDVLHAASGVGHAWIRDHLLAEAPRRGTGVVVEHRFIREIVLAAALDGLEVPVMRDRLKTATWTVIGERDGQRSPPRPSRGEGLPTAPVADGRARGHGQHEPAR